MWIFQIRSGFKCSRRRCSYRKLGIGWLPKVSVRTRSADVDVQGDRRRLRQASAKEMRDIVQGSGSALGALDALDELADLYGILRLPASKERRLVDHIGQLGTAEACGAEQPTMLTHRLQLPFG